MAERSNDQSQQGTPSQSPSIASQWNPLRAACNVLWNIASALAPYTYPRDARDYAEPSAASALALVHDADSGNSDDADAPMPSGRFQPSGDGSPLEAESVASDWVTLLKIQDADRSRVLRCRRIDDSAKAYSTFDAVLVDSVRKRDPEWHGRPAYERMGTRWPGDTQDRKYITKESTRKATIARPIDAPWPTDAELLAVFGNNLGAV
jgi:hypothetical protein